VSDYCLTPIEHFSAI